MDFWQKYSYHDYEEAYYRRDYAACKEIGLSMLSNLRDDRSKMLLEAFRDYEYDPGDPVGAKILDDVKVWLMIKSNY